MQKVLIVLTNVDHYQGTTDLTGLWLGEAAEFVDEMTQAGMKWITSARKWICSA